MNEILNCLSNMFNIAGTSKQKEFIIFFLFAFIVSHFFGGFIFGTFGKLLGTIIVYLLYVIPLISVSVRRLHDAGHSGWWALLQFTYVGGIILSIILCILPSK